jgi:hypothetical protein
MSDERANAVARHSGELIAQNGSSGVVRRSAQVVEYDNARLGKPTLPQALEQFQRSVDLNAFDDVICEYHRDRYGQISFRFRAYRK